MVNFYKTEQTKILEFPCGKGDKFGCGILVQTINRTQIYCKHCQPKVAGLKKAIWAREKQNSRRKP